MVNVLARYCIHTDLTFCLSMNIKAALLEKTKLDATTAATAEKNAAAAEKVSEAAAKKAEKDTAIAKEKAAKVSLDGRSNN